MIMHLTVGQSHNEATKAEELKQEIFMNSAVELAPPNLEGKETKKSGKRQVQKIDHGKIRPINGRKKLQVRKCLPNYQ